jgi:hypothetical protein
METIQPEEIERINSFLMQKKKAGLTKEKIQMYLNLLKFFIDHCEKRGTKVDSLKNPESFILGIKFEGLDPGVEKEYLALFMEYYSYCKLNPLDDEAAEPCGAADNETPKVKKTPGHISGSVNCHKCGYLQKMAQRCSQCGSPLHVQSTRRPKRDLKAVPEKDKASRFFLLVILFAVSVFLGWYFDLFNFIKKKDFTVEGKVYSTEIDVDESNFEPYYNFMSVKLDSIELALSKWDSVEQTEKKWIPEYEEVLQIFTALKDDFNDEEPVKEVKSLHEAVKIRIDNIQFELGEIKTKLKATQERGSSEGRKGRLFNTVNVYLTQLKEQTRVFSKILKGICRHNELACGA